MPSDAITIVGLTGSIGSGCSYLYEQFLQSRDYKLVRLSDILRVEYIREHPETETTVISTRELQKFGNHLRRSRGSGVLAKLALKVIGQHPECRKWVVDSIKNPAEVLTFKTYPRFYLLAVYSDSDVRWKRVQAKYDKNLADFEDADARDAGDDEEDYGQRVGDCYKQADIIIANNGICKKGNNEWNLLKNKVDRALGFIEGTEPFVPQDSEALMVAAYSISMRSSCRKRKVGAIIVDHRGNVISSGFNEVPRTEDSCAKEHAECYRDIVRQRYAEDLAGIVTNMDQRAALEVLHRKSLKVLDYCRALHAEESAILGAIGNCGSLEGTALYVTSYPCNLCANKIAQVGIERVIYLEPYPMREAKGILNNAGVNQEPFEGVTYNGYFRFRGDA